MVKLSLFIFCGFSLGLILILYLVPFDQLSSYRGPTGFPLNEYHFLCFLKQLKINLKSIKIIKNNKNYLVPIKIQKN